MCIYIYISDGLCFGCFGLQFIFGMMEMFKWHGMATKVFKRSKEEAIVTAGLAANVSSLENKKNEKIAITIVLPK